MTRNTYYLFMVIMIMCSRECPIRDVSNWYNHEFRTTFRTKIRNKNSTNLVVSENSWTAKNTILILYLDTATTYLSIPNDSKSFGWCVAFTDLAVLRCSSSWPVNNHPIVLPMRWTKKFPNGFSSSVHPRESKSTNFHTKHHTTSDQTSILQYLFE